MPTIYAVPSNTNPAYNDFALPCRFLNHAMPWHVGHTVACSTTYSMDGRVTAGARRVLRDPSTKFLGRILCACTTRRDCPVTWETQMPPGYFYFGAGRATLLSTLALKQCDEELRVLGKGIALAYDASTSRTEQHQGKNRLQRLSVVPSFSAPFPFACEIARFLLGRRLYPTDARHPHLVYSQT